MSQTYHQWCWFSYYPQADQVVANQSIVGSLGRGAHGTVYTIKVSCEFYDALSENGVDGLCKAGFRGWMRRHALHSLLPVDLDPGWITAWSRLWFNRLVWNPHRPPTQELRLVARRHQPHRLHAPNRTGATHGTMNLETRFTSLPRNQWPSFFIIMTHNNHAS